MPTEEHYEQLLAYISTHIPTPYTQAEADGMVIFTGGSPEEVIVRLTESAVIVEEYAVRWENAVTPTVRPRRVGMVKWRRLSESRLMTVVGELIKGARESRRSRFRECVACGRMRAPEWMADDELCRSCAERNTGIVH